MSPLELLLYSGQLYKVTLTDLLLFQFYDELYIFIINVKLLFNPFITGFYHFKSVSARF